MSISEVRRYIHTLVDEADESKLDALLEVLQPSSGRYSREDLDTFHQRIQAIEQSTAKGMSYEQSHHEIRNKNKQHGL